MIHLFHRLKPQLSRIDPLGGGLAEEIAAEQAESDHMTLDDTFDANQLLKEWDEIVSDVEKDPNWFTFSED